MTSRYLSTSQLAGLLKVGDMMIPGDNELAPFSESGSVEHVDRMLEFMTDSDRQGVKLLFAMFCFMPTILVRGIMTLADRKQHLPGLLGAPLRMINIGVKGVVMSLYYSDVGDAGIYDVMGWTPKVVERPDEEVSQPGSGAGDAGAEGRAAGVSEVLPKPPPRSLVPEGASAAESAMALARAGAAALGRLSVAERVSYIASLREIVLRRREEIIDRIQQDTGKSRSDALMSEIYGLLEALVWLEKEGPTLLADRKQHTPLTMMGKTSWTWYQPLGTVLIISPWNYPFIQALQPIATALLTGNTVVYKPSEHTPLEGLIEDLLAEAQVPPSWVQIVYGTGTVGAALIDAKPDKVFFTGSTKTGRRIAARAAKLLVPVELELGGKDAMIVFEDANIDRAAAGAAWGALTNTGQSCTSVERLYVQESIYEAFKARLLEVTEQIVQEVDEDGDADIGAMTVDFQTKIVAKHIEDAKTKGAEVICARPWDGKSKLIPPMVVDRVSADMSIAGEETFGPVIPLVPFESEEEVVRLANDSEYGLTASVWSKDLDRARRVGRALATGGVSINNVMLTEGNPALPFGGVKNSGFGRHKGEHGLHGFCNVKSVLVDKDSDKIEANWYPYTAKKYRLFDDMMTSLFGKGLLRLIGFARAGLKLESYSNKAGREGRGTRL